MIKIICSRQLVHRTEVLKRTLNPEWKPFEISVQQLCKGTKDWFAFCINNVKEIFVLLRLQNTK